MNVYQVLFTSLHFVQVSVTDHQRYMLITLCCPEFVQLFYDSICIKVVS